MNSTGAPGACSRAGATKRTSVRRSEGLSKSTYRGLRSSGERAKTRRGSPRSRAQAASSSAARKLGAAPTSSRGARRAADLRAARHARRSGRSCAARRRRSADRGTARAARGTCPRGRTTCPSSTTTSSSATRRVPAGAGSSPLDHDDVALGVHRPAARGHLDDAAARRREVDARAGLGGDRGASSPPGRGGAARTCPARAGCRRRGSRRARRGSRRARPRRRRRGDLQVGGVIVRAVPGGRPVGEGVVASRPPTSAAAARAAPRPSGPTARSPRPSARPSSGASGPSARARCASSSSAPRSNTRPHHQRDAYSTSGSERAARRAPPGRA